MGLPGLQAVTPMVSHRGINLIILTTFFLVLASVALSLRLYTNIVIRKKTVIADWLVVAAYILFWGHATVIFLDCAIGGVGFHQDALDPAYVYNNFKLGFGQQVAYALELGLVKCSLCLLFMQIFVQPEFHLVAKLVMVVSICWSIATILVAFLVCSPLAKFWDPATPGHCGNVSAAWMGIGCSDVIIDLCIISLPIPMYWPLRMPMRKKMALTFLFSLGIVTIAIGVARIITFSEIDFNDFTYEGYYSFIWSTIEPPVSITVVSCMALRPLVLDCNDFALRAINRARDYLTGSRREIRRTDAGVSMSPSRHERGTNWKAYPTFDSVRLGSGGSVISSERT